MKLKHSLLFLLITVRLFGQNYALKEIKIRDESNAYMITSSPFVDKDGFAWYSINTKGVFYRYDGKNKIKYQYFKNQEKDIWTSRGFDYWVQDKNNNVWAMNPYGAYIINPTTFKIKYISWKIKPSIGNMAMFKDSKSYAWVALDSNYLIRIDDKLHQKIYSNPLPHTKKNGLMKATFELKDGRILVQSGLDLFLADDNSLRFFGSVKAYNKNIDSKFQVAKNGQFFPKKRSGVYDFNGKPEHYAYIKELDVQIFNIPFEHFHYNKGRMINVRNNNLYINEVNAEKAQIKTIDTLTFEKAINNYVVCIDANDIFWFYTYNDIYMLKLTNNEFKKYPLFKDFLVSTRSMVSDSKDNLYVGSYSGLYKINPEKVSKKVSDTSPFYYSSMVMENDSVLWFVNDTPILRRKNLKSNSVRSFGKQAKGLSVFIKEKSKDSLWLGTSNGLYVVNKKSGVISVCPENRDVLKNATVYDLLKTHNGDIWLATNKGLIFKKKGKHFVNYGGVNRAFKYKSTICLYEAANHNIWIGTFGDGVIILNPLTGKIQAYEKSKGLSNNMVCGILESRDAMWFSTFYGLSRLNMKTQRFNNFYEENGISDNEFNIRSVYKKNDSTFYFGGLNGITEFNPKKINDKRKRYRIFLSASEYYSKKQQKVITDYLGLDEKIINLPYDKNFFSAEFAVNDLFYKEKDSYMYKIDELADGWVYMGASGVVKLSGLSPGDYNLIVKGVDFEGFETENNIKIRIHVEQIFFKTPLFIIFLIALSGFLILYEFRRKIRKQKRIFEKEKEIIQLKSNALKAQMNPHFVFNILNNMQSIMILKGELEVNKYFVAFSRLLRLTLDMSNKELVSLAEEIEYIKNYLLLNKFQLNDELNFFIDIDESIKNIEQILIPGMLVQPFVENAIIHGLIPKKNDKQLHISLFIDGSYLTVIIDDNGIGREASAILGKTRQHVYKSWSTTIVNERIKIMNATQKDSIILEIIDKHEENKVAGTKVVIKFFI